MVLASPSEPLSQLEVLVVDCQATAAAPRGHLLEIGWARVLGTTITHAHASLIALPDGEQIPPAVARITGISEHMMRSAVDGRCAWRELSDQAASLTQQPAPTVIHFARFEQPFLRTLAAGVFPLDVVCTRDIARRLLPNLPRCSLRALAGYFGRAVGALRRSADHVEATAFVWQELVRLLERQGVSTWGALHDWLAGPVKPTASPTPRLADAARRAAFVADMRLASIACFGQTAASCTSARQRRCIIGSTATFGSRTACPSGCSRCCRRHARSRSTSHQVRSRPRSSSRTKSSGTDRPTTSRSRFRTARCGSRRRISARVVHSRRHTARSDHLLRPRRSIEFGALARAERAALTSGSRGPDDGTFTAGYDRLCATHPELSRVDLSAHAKLLRLGTRLWREGRRDRDVDEDDANDASRGLSVWTPEFVQVSLEWLALRAALARRRAIWLTRLFDSSVVWREPGDSCARLIVIENGEVVLSRAVDANARHRFHRVTAVQWPHVVRPSPSPPSIACGY